VIDAVVVGYNSVRTAQSIIERFSGCPPMSDRSGRYVRRWRNAAAGSVLCCPNSSASRINFDSRSMQHRPNTTRR